MENYVLHKKTNQTDILIKLGSLLDFECLRRNPPHSCEGNTNSGGQPSTNVNKTVKDLSPRIIAHKTTKTFGVGGPGPSSWQSSAAGTKATQTRLHYSWVEVIATSILRSSSQSGYPLLNIHISNDNEWIFYFLCRWILPTINPNTFPDLIVYISNAMCVL